MLFGGKLPNAPLIQTLTGFARTMLLLKFPNFGDVVDVADKADVADGKITKCTFDTTPSPASPYSTLLTQRGRTN
jgi:hypothetical protein